MRLMLRHVEVAHAQRKVHRVEIFECRREEEQVRTERENGGCADNPLHCAPHAPTAITVCTMATMSTKNKPFQLIVP
jgi:hypothetical protein